MSLKTKVCANNFPLCKEVINHCKLCDKYYCTICEGKYLKNCSKCGCKVCSNCSIKLNENIYCKICEIIYTIEKDEDKTKCEVCGKELSSIFYKTHLNVHYHFTCVYCGLKVHDMEKHLMEKHKTSKKCEYCGESYIESDEIHMTSKLHEKIQCPLCPIEGETNKYIKSKLNEHIKKDHSITKCDYCKCDIKSENWLEHITNCESRNNKYIYCGNKGCIFKVPKCCYLNSDSKTLKEDNFSEKILDIHRKYFCENEYILSKYSVNDFIYCPFLNYGCCFSIISSSNIEENRKEIAKHLTTCKFMYIHCVNSDSNYYHRWKIAEHEKDCEHIALHKEPTEEKNCLKSNDYCKFCGERGTQFLLHIDSCKYNQCPRCCAKFNLFNEFVNHVFVCLREKIKKN